jgi:hypothetical protein
MGLHKSNPLTELTEYYLSKLNWFEMDLYNQNYVVEKDDWYDYENRIHTSVYRDDKLYCEIIVGTHTIWPGNAITLGQQAHCDLAS